MKTTYLEERQHYEDRYDNTTVYVARIKMTSFMDFRAKWLEKMPDNKENKYRNPWHLNHFYMLMVGSLLVERYDGRERAVIDMLAEDKALDEQISAARLTTEPHCEHCNKTGLRITDKMLMSREGHDNDDILFMLKCAHCEKNTAYWQDGTLWEHRQTKCPKCQSVMGLKSIRRSKVITTTYTCPNCQHAYKDRLDLNRSYDPIDPDYEEDRRIFCLQDEEILKEHREGKYRMEDLIRFSKEMQEKEDNKHIYDAVKEIKKPKIAELKSLLSEPFEKAGYSEFHLDKPEISEDVYVAFSCLDSKSDRNDYDSRKNLKKIVDEILLDTNWRLMSDGISYRLGYLNGRVRAYEREEDLKQLVIKTRKLKLKQQTPDTDNNDGTIRGKDSERIIL